MGLAITTNRRLKFRLNGREYETKGGGQIEVAPSWVEQDAYFAMAKRAGVLNLVSKTSSPQKVQKKGAPTPAPEGGSSPEQDAETARKLLAQSAELVLQAIAATSSIAVLEGASTKEGIKNRPRTSVMRAIAERIAELKAE